MRGRGETGMDGVRRKMIKAMDPIQPRAETLVALK